MVIEDNFESGGDLESCGEEFIEREMNYDQWLETEEGKNWNNKLNDRAKEIQQNWVDGQKTLLEISDPLICVKNIEGIVKSLESYTVNEALGNFFPFIENNLLENIVFNQRSLIRIDHPELEVLEYPGSIGLRKGDQISAKLFVGEIKQLNYLSTHEKSVEGNLSPTPWNEYEISTPLVYVPRDLTGQEKALQIEGDGFSYRALPKEIKDLKKSYFKKFSVSSSFDKCTSSQDLSRVAIVEALKEFPCPFDETK
jgi:hypothetical protein